MLGIIDKFKFEINKKQLDSISHEISWNWAESQRIGNHVKLQATGKSKESFTFNGTLLLKNVNSFDELVNIANKQKPVSLKRWYK